MEVSPLPEPRLRPGATGTGTPAKMFTSAAALGPAQTCGRKGSSCGLDAALPARSPEDLTPDLGEPTVLSL